MRLRLGTSALLLLCLILSGCGFQLRGSGGLSPAWQPLRLTGDLPNSDLHQLVQRELSVRGIELSEGTGEAPLQLLLNGREQEIRTISLDDQARAAEFALFQRVTLELRKGDGIVLAGPQRIHIRRVIINDPNNPVGEAAERGMLFEEMTEALAARVADQLVYWGNRLPEAP